MSSSQLTVIESARISAIIEEALEKLSFLASITPDVMAHRDELSQIVGDEITRIIQEQRGLETRYEALIAQRTSLKALSNKTKFQENQEHIKEVAKALRESTKELCRNLKGNPNIAENLTKIQTERSNLQNLLSKTLRELRECSFATLTTTVEEEEARNDMIKEVVQKEKEVSAAVKKLHADLANEKLMHGRGCACSTRPSSSPPPQPLSTPLDLSSCSPLGTSLAHLPTTRARYAPHSLFRVDFAPYPVRRWRNATRSSPSSRRSSSRCHQSAIETNTCTRWRARAVKSQSRVRLEDIGARAADLACEKGVGD